MEKNFKMIIDANNLIAGRVATFAAKKALNGEKVDIINCEKVVMSGNKDFILNKYKNKREMGRPTKGPFYLRSSDRFVRRIVRGMLPYKQAKGRDAYSRIMCYNSVPPELEGKDAVSVPGANLEKLPNYKFVSVKDICRYMGGKS